MTKWDLSQKCKAGITSKKSKYKDLSIAEVKKKKKDATKVRTGWEFSGCPVISTWHFHCLDLVSIPG